MLQAAFPVEAVIAIDGSSSGFWPGKTNVFFKYFQEDINPLIL